jgi:hypothetical protein
VHEPPLEERFAVLCRITRAQHFAWRQALRELHPGLDVGALVDRMWKITGEATGSAYARRMDTGVPVAAQVAESVAWSSQCMGEDASVESGVDDREAFVRHHACPWFHWHRKQNLLDEDRRGCDAWFAATVETIGRELALDLRFETLSALPSGDPCCLRRFWIAEAPPVEQRVRRP